MHRLPIKAISLNSAYRGRRFATAELKQYKSDIAYLLPHKPPLKGKLALTLHFGVSSKNSDGDNLIKCFQDALADKYGFNDKQIYKWNVEKVDVKKGEEYIAFKIEKYV